VLAYSIGNEIPPDVVRWHGKAAVERFLRELADVAKQVDPDGLVTYGNYPPTEYLDLSFLDFATFNVYLHDPETFHRYLLRLQNLVGERPLVLGEIGMDTLRHGELAQADFLSGHVREAVLAGVAGTFVFSWTDQWHTGGQAIEDWAFGITAADRRPKPSYHALREVLELSPNELLPAQPSVSVVVCSYNGASTLGACLHSLADLDYPDYEVIVVDDGSTDDTRAVLANFPDVRAIHQPNQGLSVARNVGLAAAAGAIVAYTDSDCVADRDWLTCLVARLERSGAAAVGGPNLAPEDGRVAACIAACPGQPMHVLESDQVAEHIPGCNMAFRREALQAINGFDPQFHKAGDDVDICWRLQQAGFWITFAPSAFVWHHRRQTPRRYLKQQAGYGEAEALLRFKHPDRFNGRGHGKWRGMIYGASLQGLVLDDAIIYRGTFGTGPFQCIYQPGPAHWAMVPSTIEWNVLAAAIAWMGVLWWPVLALGGAMLALSVLVAVLQAAQARLAPAHDGPRSRLLIAALCYTQPLVRAWARYRTRYFTFHASAVPGLEALSDRVGRWRTSHSAAYWGTGRPERTDLLRRVIAHLEERHCGKSIDTGWSDCDLEVFRDPWTLVRIKTAQEDHGAGRRLVRVRHHVRWSKLAKAGILLGSATALLLALSGTAAVAAWTATLLVLLAVAWWRGTRLLAHMAALFDNLAQDMGLVRIAFCDRSKPEDIADVAPPPNGRKGSSP
jgi:GT2 family glycosyltransferase